MCVLDTPSFWKDVEKCDRMALLVHVCIRTFWKDPNETRKWWYRVGLARERMGQE